VREAVDGGQAVQAAADASWPIDVVLLDYHLPDTSDLELLTAMRCLLPQSDLILMTADESSDLVSRACALGASGVLRKPFNMAELAPFADAHRDRGRSH
jgi:DNA-binding response OmpR family regulator